MSTHSVKEWRCYILTRGVFGNALKFSHFEALGNVTRTPMGARSDAISDRSVRNRIRAIIISSAAGELTLGIGLGFVSVGLGILGLIIKPDCEELSCCYGVIPIRALPHARQSALRL